MAPASRLQNPATMRRSVVLPHPDGPRRVKSSPLRTMSETSRTAATDPNDRLTDSMAISDKCCAGGYQPGSAGFLNGVLDLCQGVVALPGPAILVVFEELEAGKRRHVSRKLREVDVLARWPAERRAEDHLAGVLGIDPVHELLRRFAIRAALDDRTALHEHEGAVAGTDRLHRRTALGPEIPGVFQRDAERVFAIADALEHQRGAVQHLEIGEELLHPLPALVAAAPLIDEQGRVGEGGARIGRIGEGDLALPFGLEQILPALRSLLGRQLLGVLQDDEKLQVVADPQIAGVAELG